MFFYSILSIFESIGFVLAHPRIWIYVLAPIFINFVVFIFSIFLFFEIFESINDWGFLRSIFEKIAVLEYVLDTIWIIVSLIISYLIFINLSMTIGSPFYGEIAEIAMEELNVPYIDETKTIFRQAYFDLKRSIDFEIKKIVLSLLLLIITFPINLMPIFGPLVYGIINFLFAISMSSLDFFDCTLERMRLNFKTKYKFILDNYYVSAPFGFITLTLTSIPIINLVVMPFLTISAVKIYSRIIKNS